MSKGIELERELEQKISDNGGRYPGESFVWNLPCERSREWLRQAGVDLNNPTKTETLIEPEKPDIFIRFFGTNIPNVHVEEVKRPDKVIYQVWVDPESNLYGLSTHIES